MVRYLTINILLLALLASCSLRTTEGLRQVAFTQTEVENPYFSNPQRDYVYRAKIDLYRKNFSGILIIKKIGATAHRIVFTTEFGSKLFDFEMDGNTFTKHAILEDMDKEMVVNLLREDFHILLTEKAKVVAVYESPTQRIYKTESGDGFNFYFMSNQAHQLQKIVNTTKTKERVTMEFFPAAPNLADSVAITHKNLKLAIGLKNLKTN